MVNFPQSDRAVLSEIYHFRCSHCFQALQVPMTFAGHSAPCPFCLETTTAPSPPQPAPSPAQQHHSPPAPTPAPSSRIEFACPCCHSGLSVPAELAGVTGPCLYCGTHIAAPQLTIPPTANDILDEMLRARARPSPVPVQRQSRHLSPEPPDRPSHAEETLAAEARRTSESREPSTLIKKRKHSSSTRRSGTLLGTLGVVTLVFGIAGATVFFAGPGKNLFSGDQNQRDSSTSEQTLQNALANRDRLEKDKNRAITEAFSCVRDFLTSADWSEARAYAIGAPQTALGSQIPQSIKAEPKDLTFHSAERVPGTENFIVKHWLNPGEGRVPAAIWVENTETGPRIRWDFLEQQLSGKIQQFKDSETAPPARFYARLQLISEEDNPLTDLPELENVMMVAISSAFSESETEAFYAFAPIGSSVHAKLDTFLQTTQSLEGWIDASRSNTPSGHNLIMIKDFNHDITTQSSPRMAQKSPISFNYGNSGLPR